MNKCPTCEREHEVEDFVSYGQKFCNRGCRIEFNAALEAGIVWFDYESVDGKAVRLPEVRVGDSNWRSSITSFFGEVEGGYNTITMDDETPAERVRYLEDIYDCDLEEKNG